MSRLDAVQLADICRKAGFVRDELPTAVATAIAASGGAPHYRVAVWPGPVADYRGLWALDIVRYPQYAGRPLDTPHAAARIAVEACDEQAGWSWCGTYRNGTYLAHLDAATVAATMYPGTMPERVPVGPEALRSHIERAQLTVARLQNLPSIR